MMQYSTIDEYISHFPAQLQVTLEELRSFIQKQVPEAKQKIAYGIPTFIFNGNLIHFAAYPSHYGLYPGSAPIKQLAKDLQAYETSKGTVKFPIDKPLPYPLIKKIVAACVQRNLSKDKTY